MLNINKKISPYNYESGNNVKYIVIHSTGNTNDTAKNNIDYFYNGDRGSSAHYFVDDNSIWQSVEEWNCSWHCGDGNGVYDISNYNSIGIEMCGTANGYISEQTVNNTIELTKYLMNKYNIGINNVTRHYDASRKNCPSQFSPNNWTRWTQFKNKLSGNNINTSTNISKNELKITADVLNVRNKPNGNIIGQVHEGEVYKIDKKIDDWYSIYWGNNGGYVSADYVKTEYNTPTQTSKPIQDNREYHRNIIVYKDGAEPDRISAEFMAMILNFRKEDAKAIPLSKMNKYKGGSVFSIGASNVKCHKELKGNNRYDTAESVLEHLIKTQK